MNYDDLNGTESVRKIIQEAERRLAKVIKIIRRIMDREGTQNRDAQS
jgi:hypothetical protein